jgi:hypothetical protein
MTASPVERRLRSFCRALAVVACSGALTELWLVEHTGSKLQWLPFGLCAVTIASVGLVSVRMTRRVVRGHRLLMVLVVIGGGYGVYVHLSHNMTFYREIQPSASPLAIWSEGLRGANPLLAAGVLAMAGALGLAGTYGWERPRT